MASGTSPSTLAFQPSCPQGGSWFACGNGAKFVGCCTTNPCNVLGCSQSNLRPASFLASQMGKFVDQTCASSSAKWYTCNATSTRSTFLGCCASNACSSTGCSTADLRAGMLSSIALIANQYKPDPPLASTTTSTTLTSTTSTRSSTSSTSTGSSTTTTPTSTSSPTAIASSSGPSMGAATITGIVIGAVAGLIILMLAIIFLIRQRRKKKENKMTPEQLRFFAGKKWEAVSQTEHSPAMQQGGVTPQPPHSPAMYTPNTYSQPPYTQNTYNTGYNYNPTYNPNPNSYPPNQHLTAAYVPSPYPSGSYTPNGLSPNPHTSGVYSELDSTRTSHVGSPPPGVIHEAGGREVTYQPYSPPPHGASISPLGKSPRVSAIGSDSVSVSASVSASGHGTQSGSVSGLGARSTTGTGSAANRAELG